MTASAAGPGPEKFAGCLIGQSLGDALGFVVEGQPPDACRAYVEVVVKGGRAARGQRGPFAFGQYSDDSQLARELLQSYVACGGFEAADYAGRVAAIFTEGRIVGRGRSTEAAALRLAAGVPWTEAGTPPPAAGNGSAMRAGPIGLIFHDDPERLIAAAHDQGRLTHADARCSAGAVAIAGAVALALDEAPINTAAFLGTLSGWAGAIEPSLAAYLEELAGWVALPPAEAVKKIAGAGHEPGFGEPWPGISPFVVPSVLWSLYAFLRTPDDYWQAVCTAIAVGGDVDTTAAMTGAIAGARRGLAAIPADLAARLNDQGTWGTEALTALARRTWEIKTGG
ncbi:MAG: ADP-ribosylglycohydrolase family protein [Rhodospirillales bacterium]|jgi:ADP-ribosylglycohydrolase|nr:ADP-ribosylglycohydrolase family protein [Rhodospirillales bacterium]MDP6773319.1 ADP-ribosylglycohydrolase family protein [Rhodospirillales bacterium]